MRILLQHGTDPDAKENNWQATPLRMALHHRHWLVIEVLLPTSRSLFDVCQMVDAKRASILLENDPPCRGSAPRGAIAASASQTR